MKRGQVKKFFKIFSLFVLLLLAVVGYFLYRFTSPRTDHQIEKELSSETQKPLISYRSFKGRKVRAIEMSRKKDTSLPTLIFVHGSPGSAMDFKRYLKDTILNKLAHLVCYDRIGYGPFDRGKVLESLDEEVSLFHQLLEGRDTKKIIAVGYSYGGTVVMASGKPIKKKIVLAAAVKGELEPDFWALKLYKSKLTRPLVPHVLRAASIEKIRHIEELPGFDEQWNRSPSKVLSIHGKKDRIVPYENSLYLSDKLDPGKYELISLKEGNHSLIWTNFELIKTELIKSIREP